MAPGYKQKSFIYDILLFKHEKAEILWLQLPRHINTDYLFTVLEICVQPADVTCYCALFKFNVS